jgi:hypothetical protein
MLHAFGGEWGLATEVADPDGANSPLQDPTIVDLASNDGKAPPHQIAGAVVTSPKAVRLRSIRRKLPRCARSW